MKSYTPSRFAPILKKLQVELAAALNSLGGKPRDGLFEGYIFYTCALINRAVEGYILLREAGRIEASKLLIRGAIECMFRIQAVQKSPDLLFRVAFSEFEEDKKWLGANDSVARANISANWDTFKNSYQAKYPGQSYREEVISLRALAQKAGLEGYYDTHYRLYCRFTHGALRASSEGLSEFEQEDDRTMALSSLAATKALLAIAATAPNFVALEAELQSLYATP